MEFWKMLYLVKQVWLKICKKSVHSQGIRHGDRCPSCATNYEGVTCYFTARMSCSLHTFHENRNQRWNRNRHVGHSRTQNRMKLRNQNHNSTIYNDKVVEYIYKLFHNNYSNEWAQALYWRQHSVKPYSTPRQHVATVTIHRMDHAKLR